MIVEVAETLKYLQARLNQAREILRIAREGPHAYDKDRPAGLRIHFRRKDRHD